MSIMKLEISEKTMSTIVESIRPLSKDTYMRIDFGTGISEDKMSNKLTVTTGIEQIEQTFFTNMPLETTRDITNCHIQSPAATVVCKTNDFIVVADALLLYETVFKVSVSNSEIVLEVEGKAIMPISLCDGSNMKAVIPHPYNSEKAELHDPEIMYIRMTASNFLNCTKRFGAVVPKNSNENEFYTVKLKDCKPVIKQIPAKDHAVKDVVVKNAVLNFLYTDGRVITSATTDIIHEKNKTICTYIRQQDEVETTFNKVETPFTTYKAAYEAQHKIEVKEDEYLFALPLNVVAVLSRIAANATILDMTLGIKFIRVMIKPYNVMYTAALYAAPSSCSVNAYNSLSRIIEETGCKITVDGAGISKGLKLFAAYDGDIYRKNLPLEMRMEDKKLIFKKEAAEIIINSIEYASNQKSFMMGIQKDYLNAILSALPAGNVTIFYGLEKSLCAICAGSELPSSGNGNLIAGVNIEEARKAMEAKKEADQKAAEKKSKK